MKMIKIESKYNIPFSENRGLSLYVNNKDVELEAVQNGQYIGNDGTLQFELNISEKKKELVFKVSIKNDSGNNITVNNLGIRLGIDSYMENYPEWNNRMFPTMLRCEPTHLWGYFMSPLNEMVAVVVPEPVASWHLEYNKAGEDFGHRIYTACIDFFCDGKLPERNPQNQIIKANEQYCYDVHLIPTDNISEIRQLISEIGKVPVVESEKYTCQTGEKLNFSIISKEQYVYEITDPDGMKFDERAPLHKCGQYVLTVRNVSGKIAKAIFYCRKKWEFYLKAARKECLRNQQKASTHCEAWYGFFSGFLAAKHYPENNTDWEVKNSFEEILPYMYDLNTGTPIVCKTRIQNTAAMISLLVDKYESNPEQNMKDLRLASKMGDFLMGCQSKDGAYRSGKAHYTCVIYIAKSMMELVEAENNCGDTYLKDRSKVHYESVGRAIEDLVIELDQIGTEGEHTLEDGMISCSALQIAMYALTLPEEQRFKYIEAAEHMIRVHLCLEQKLVPDARMNGGSLRFWEAQYDVLLKANFMNSPHGWTAWTIYAKYYLYMLTSKTEYLKEMINAMGACVQLMDLNGKLRWAFAVDPQIKGKMIAPDTEKTVEDGYQAVKYSKPAYRGKFTDTVIGEEYVNMISDWYRMGSQKVNGGYDTCPLILGEAENVIVDTQGGCCDNDVHEIFKCMEETVLKKAFIAEDENGKIYTCSCRYEHGTVYLLENCEKIHINLKKNSEIKIVLDNGNQIVVEANKKAFWYDL